MAWQKFQAAVEAMPNMYASATVQAAQESPCKCVQASQTRLDVHEPFAVLAFKGYYATRSQAA